MFTSGGRQNEQDLPPSTAQENLVARTIGEAKLIAAAIQVARTPAEARSLMGMLMQLAGSPPVLSSPEARMIVTQGLASGSSVCEYLETAEYTEQMNHQVAQERFAISRSHEALAQSVTDNQIWLSGEREFFESINPNTSRSIAMLDENGRRVISGGQPAVAQVNGARLRESLAIYNAYASQDQLDAKGREHLNTLLYGNAAGPRSEEERKKGDRRLQEAIREVEGIAAHDGGTPQSAQAAERRAQGDLSRLRRRSELQDRQARARTDPGITAPTPEEVNDAEQKFRHGLQASRCERKDERLQSGPSRAAAPTPAGHTPPGSALDLLESQMRETMGSLSRSRSARTADRAAARAATLPPAAARTAPLPHSADGELAEIRASLPSSPPAASVMAAGSPAAPLAGAESELAAIRSTLQPSVSPPPGAIILPELPLQQTPDSAAELAEIRATLTRLHDTLPAPLLSEPSSRFPMLDMQGPVGVSLSIPRPAPEKTGISRL